MQLWQVTRKIHTSWLIALFSGGVVIGTALVPMIDQTQFGSVVWLYVGLIIAGLILWQRFIYLAPLIIVAGLFIGLWRGSILESQLIVYQKIIGHQVHLIGTVSDDPDTGKHGEILLRVSNVKINNHVVMGKVWISTTHASDLKRGDTVNVTGKIGEGFGSFAAAMFQAKVVSAQRPQPGDLAGQVRDWFGDHVRRAIAEPQASLGLGYLVGQRRALPPELDQALVIAGLTHVVVASGYNLTILVRLARRLFVKISKYLSALAATTMIVAFMAVTGASPSMSRAGLVSGLSLAAWYYGRRFHPLVLLPFAAAITVLIDPTYAWNDLGWQLSFTAFAGVMILAPLLQRYFFGETKPSVVRQIIGETISASIATLPILILAFGQFSNVALITNLLVLPFVPIAMLLTFVAGIGAIAMPSAAQIIGMPAQLLLAYMTNVVQYFAGLDWAQSLLTIQPWIVWVCYAFIVSLCIYLWQATKYDLRESSIVE